MASIKKVVSTRGTRYRVRWREDGRSVERWFVEDGQGRGKKAADDLKNRLERDALDGVRFDSRPGRGLLNDYFADWLPARLVKGRPLTDSTRLGYRKVWARNMIDGIGRRELRGLTPKVVREWHAEVTAAKGADQAAKAYRLLRAVLTTAESDEVIRANPCKIRGAGQEYHDERPLVETSLVYELADAIGERYRPLPLLAGFAALRTGESLGLRRRDVNLLHGRVAVRSQSQELDGQQLFVDRTKSDAGMRTIPLMEATLKAAIEDHLARFVATGADAVLFTSPEGGPLRRAELSAAWCAAKAVTGAPEGLRLHDLRHHALTLAARGPGVTTKDLMAFGGHSSPRAALIYQHSDDNRLAGIAGFIAEQAEAARGAIVGRSSTAG